MEENSVNVTRDMVNKYKELHTIMQEFRKSLGPRKEIIFNGVMEAIDVQEIFDLIEVSGGESISISGEVEGKTLTIMFRLK